MINLENDETMVFTLTNVITQNRNQEKVLESIEQLSKFNLSTKAKETLIELTKVKDWEIKMYSLESLSHFSGEDVVSAVCSATLDKEPLVRITAAEILGDWRNKKGIPFLINALLDKDELVRSAAAQSLGEIGEPGLSDALIKGLEVEKRNMAKLGFYIGLILLGQKQFLNNFISLLKNKSYRIRSAVANSAVYISDKDNYCIILKELAKARSREKTIAALSDIEEAIKFLEDMYNQN